MAAIRAHHRDAAITLLTTAPYRAFLADCPYFDAISIDDRPAWWNLPGWRALRRRLIEGRFHRVYDLQTSRRSSAYLRLFPRDRRPEWSGIARGASHPHVNPGRDAMHTIDRQAEQLRAAGIAAVPAPDLGWVADAPAPALPDGRFVLLAPGGAVHRPQKRWPAERFAALARALAARGLGAVVVGTADEAPLASAIRSGAPGTIDLTGRTDLADIVRIARRAAAAVGNDTGPMHLAAVAGCPSVVLFSAVSDPALCAPRGAAVVVLRAGDLAGLPVADVHAARAW
ncbi:MAG: glycosyltransferase family 9 protein [Alphaproteobacteria bacterium]